MRLVTFLWSLNAAIALMFAAVCALAWLVDRRDVAKLMFCVTAVATAAATPFELGMMQARTASELGELLRWYHVPIFFTLIGQMLFVRYYLGTGRLWLLWTIIPIRVFVLVANFFVHPNFNFLEISSLQHIVFLGEQVSVVGESTPRAWQWLAAASMVLLVTFVVDATIQGWRNGGSESRRKALTVGLAIIVPMVGNLTMNQMVVSGVVHVPVCATLWFLGTLAVIACELGRELILSNRARLQLAELRREWAQVERVNSLGQLASALAHELTQPVAATRMNVDAAKRCLLSAAPNLEELRSIMDDVHENSLRAAEIIDRMRAFITGRTLVTQAFRLDDVAQDVFSLLRHEATSRRVDLRCNVPRGLPSASGDRVHIAQVILNLLINGMDAVQDRPASARRVTLEARVAEAENLEVTVRDSGPGIPRDRLEELFNPLYTTKTQGLGIGLALSRMIVDAHGGRLWAENGELGGAVFRFTLPRGPRARSRVSSVGLDAGAHI
jgi:signal transduction histidine kinase